MAGRAVAKPYQYTGKVSSIQASGGSAGSCLFQFNLDNVHDHWFQLCPEAPPGIFAAMAGVLTAAHFAAGRDVSITCDVELQNGGLEVSFVEVPPPVPGGP